MTASPFNPSPRRGHRVAVLATLSSLGVLSIFAVVAFPIAVELYWTRELERAAALVRPGQRGQAVPGGESSPAAAGELRAVLEQLRKLRVRRAGPQLLEISSWESHGPRAGEGSEFATSAREILHILDLPDSFYLQHLSDEPTAVRLEAMRILRNRRARVAAPALAAMIAARDPLAPVAAVTLAALQPTLTYVGIEYDRTGQRARLQVRNGTGAPLRVKRTALALYAREADGFRHELRPNLAGSGSPGDDLLEPGAKLDLLVSIDGLPGPAFVAVTIEDAAERSAGGPDGNTLPVTIELFSAAIDPGPATPRDESRP